VLTLRATANKPEFLDASEGIAAVLDHADELDLTAPLVSLLIGLDEAITEALRRDVAPGELFALSL
jgi:hypothetical protein